MKLLDYSKDYQAYIWQNLSSKFLHLEQKTTGGFWDFENSKIREKSENSKSAVLFWFFLYFNFLQSSIFSWTKAAKDTA